MLHKLRNGKCVKWWHFVCRYTLESISPHFRRPIDSSTIRWCTPFDVQWIRWPTLDSHTNNNVLSDPFQFVRTFPIQMKRRCARGIDVSVDRSPRRDRHKFRICSNNDPLRLSLHLAHSMLRLTHSSWKFHYLNRCHSNLLKPIRRSIHKENPPTLGNRLRLTTFLDGKSVLSKYGPIRNVRSTIFNFVSSVEFLFIYYEWLRRYFVSTAIDLS